MMSNATQAVVDGKFEPINKAEPTRPLVVTGQGLYNLFFVEAEEQSRTRMDQIRKLVLLADAVQIQGATDAMVELARKADIAGGMDDKDAEGKKNRGPKQRSAMNVRTNVRNIWGAMKFVGSALECGYQEACVLAREDLNSYGVLWDGKAAPTDQSRAQARALREQKAMTTAMLDATKATPRAQGESMTSWQARIADVAAGEVEKAREQIITDKAQKLFDKAQSEGSEVQFALFKLLADQFGFEVNTSEDMDEETANKALQAAADAGEVTVHTEESETV
jgi:hypothetical protein